MTEDDPAASDDDAKPAGQASRTEPTVAPRKRIALALTLLAACALLPYAGTLGHGFVNLDDPVTIINHSLLRHLDWSSLPAFFKPDLYPGLPEYMPLKNLSYAIDEAIFGRDPRAYRPQQLLWYLLSVVALWAWLRKLLGDLARAGRMPASPGGASGIALATAVLFAVHPVHVESVTWLSGRKDVLSGCFLLTSLWCGAHFEGLAKPRGGRWLTATLVAAALALLSKPTAVVLPALLLLQDLLRTPRATWLRVPLGPRAPLYAGVTLMTGAFAFAYHDLTQLHATARSGIEWRLYEGPLYLRWAEQLLAFLRLSLMPGELTPVLPVDELCADPMSLRGAFSLTMGLAMLGMAALSLWRRSVFALAFGLFLVPLAPILVAPPWGQYVAGRYLFHGVAGPLLGAVLLGARLISRRPELARAAVAALVLATGSLMVATLSYNALWRDGYTLWMGALEVHPRFTRFHQLAAGAALEQGRPEDAIPVLARCVEVEPHHAPCSALLGGLLAGPQPEQAERILRGALDNDRAGDVHLELARLLQRTGRADEAVRLLESWMEGRSVAPSMVEALVRLSLTVGDLERAERYARAHLQAMVVTHPAAPPPVALWQALAHARGDPALAQRVRRAARFGRADEFAGALLRRSP